MKPLLLNVAAVNKTFVDEAGHRVPVLKDIHFQIATGEFFVFVGPSGSGKSTLLRIMSGLEKAYEGTVTWSKPLTAGDVSFVFQQFALLPWLTVHENVELGLLCKNMSASQRSSAVHSELKRLGLEKFAHTYPHALSGGMRQRVGIARAFATSPKVVFMDEPFSELDSFTAAELRQDLLRLWQERHPTIIMVTHLIDEAVLLADRVAVLTQRPARIEQIVINRLPRPRTRRSPEFFALEDELCALIKP